ncbi:Uma2 family endonuclease [Kitasatospora sp. NBC_01266]|uniref:Uma2 family endonuclease n=1 Tax=Kitasatospora sp. NBC_01266 TaxID=2903572 RepID=UPI002E337A87|nr:Uma2 family endonuclease [Kitasatospora sp. NBC_01266]
MSVAAIAHYMLPDSPYALWVRGELADHLHLSKDGTRVEVIGGEMFVSPAPAFAHAGIIATIQRVVDGRGFVDPQFPWRSMQMLGLDMVELGDGYIPDLLVFHVDTETRAWSEDARFLTPHQVELVVEVTSKSNAHNDREPVVGRRARGTRWSGYARAGIAHYLLIDRDPKQPQITLHGNPDRFAGRYEELLTWKFGELVQLPEPLGFEFRTDLWRPWED